MNGEPASRWMPTCLHEETSPSSARRTLLVDEGLGWFQGHFPGEPILSGVVQLTWAVSLLRSLVGTGFALVAVSQLKFRRPIRPGDEVELAVTLDVGGAAAAFSFRSKAGTHSTGRVAYRER